MYYVLCIMYYVLCIMYYVLCIIDSCLQSESQGIPIPFRLLNILLVIVFCLQLDIFNL